MSLNRHSAPLHRKVRFRLQGPRDAPPQRRLHRGPRGEGRGVAHAEPQAAAEEATPWALNGGRWKERCSKGLGRFKKMFSNQNYKGKEFRSEVYLIAEEFC